MKRIILIFAITSIVSSVKSQSAYFPPLTGTSWETVSPISLGWCEDKIDTLYNFLGQTNSKAFIILQDGKIALEKYYGTYTRDSLWYWASAGKSLTSVLVGIAQQEGYLSIGDTTSKYLGSGWTACPPDKEAKITIRSQLTMTTGLNDNVEDNYCTIDTCLQYLADAGTRWAYHNAPYTMLDPVIEEATGQNLNSWFNSKIGAVTGINGAYYPNGYNNTFVSNARSMARFGLLVLNRCKWDSTLVLADTGYFNQMVNTSQTLNNAYGYLWWLNGKTSFMVPSLQYVFPGFLEPDAPADMISALGKNGQIINVVPGRNLVFIRMGNEPGSGEISVTYNNDIWKILNTVFCNTHGISDNESDHTINIYPNPAKDILNISGNVGIPAIYQISDLFGRIRMRGSIASSLDISQLSKGVYLISILNEQKVYIRKLFKE
jgi:CubicO group peptidase (beta-lactamase class C family)